MTKPRVHTERQPPILVGIIAAILIAIGAVFALTAIDAWLDSDRRHNEVWGAPICPPPSFLSFTTGPFNGERSIVVPDLPVVYVVGQVGDQLIVRGDGSFMNGQRVLFPAPGATFVHFCKIDIPAPTTTEVPPSSTTTTTPPSSSTTPSTTTTVVPTTTSAPTTTVPESTSTSSPTTSLPPTTAPPSSSSTTPPPPTSEPPSSEPPPPTVPPPTVPPTLPETGAGDWMPYYWIAISLLLCGAGAVAVARRP